MLGLAAAGRSQRKPDIEVDKDDEGGEENEEYLDEDDTEPFGTFAGISTCTAILIIIRSQDKQDVDTDKGGDEEGEEEKEAPRKVVIIQCAL